MTRYALVLGNSAYPHELRLQSPRHDAEQMAIALRRLHFEVTLGIDLGYDQINYLIDEFLNQIDADHSYVTVVYYSGHGVQIEEQNFVVPVDFQEGETVKLVSVQGILDRVANYSNLQIVLLDACRSNFEAEQILRGKTVSIGGGKIIFKERQEPMSGFAEMRGPSSTFIAFAAAPGAVAYDGDTLLSPFTDAFLKHVDRVDLPLSNLMSRVRQEVYENTGHRQRTWDHSSLMAPFYFNPGSMFLFMGNALAVLGLILSLVPYSLCLSSSEPSWTLIALSLIFPMLSLLILMFGAQAVYSRLRGAAQHVEGRQITLRNHLIASLQKGSLGGYIGSLVAAIWASLVYYHAWLAAFNNWVERTVSGKSEANAVEPTKTFEEFVERLFNGAYRFDTPPEPLATLTVKITIAATVCACILGFLTVFFARVRFVAGKLVLSTAASDLSVIGGTALGGVLTGLMCAPFLTYHFGSQEGPKAMPELLLPSGIVGAAIIVFSIVNFDFERLSSRRLIIGFISAFGAVVLGGLATAGLFVSLYYMGIVDLVVDWLSRNSDNALIMMSGGAVYGVPVGLALGVVVGLALTFTRKWTGRDVWESF